jgi:hypothetical protein
MPDVSDIAGLPDWLKAILSQQSGAPGGGLFSGGDVPAPQNIGLLAGGPPAFTSVNPNAPAFQTGPTAVQDQYADVPLPPRRPADASMFQANASDVTSSPASLAPPSRPNANVEGTPASGAPEAVASAAPQSPGLGGYLGKASDLIGSIYGAGGPGDALIALGLSNRTGGASVQALNSMNANRASQANVALKQLDYANKLKATNSSYDYLIRQGVDPATARAATEQAAVGNTEPLKTLFNQYSGPDRYKFLTTGAGDNIAVDMFNPGKPAIPVGPQGGKPELTDVPVGYKDGLPLFQKGYVSKGAAIGPNGEGATLIGQPFTKQPEVSVNTGLNPIVQGAGKAFMDRATAAQAAADEIRALHDARSQLDKPGGIISGFRAGDRVAMQQLAGLFGADTSRVQNSQTFEGAMKPVIMAALGGSLGTGVSNADRDFLQRAAGGDIRLDEGAIRRLSDIMEKAARGKIQRANEEADKYIKLNPEVAKFAPSIKTDMPPEYKPPGQDQPAGLPPNARKAPDGNFYVPDPGRPGKYLMWRP